MSPRRSSRSGSGPGASRVGWSQGFSARRRRRAQHGRFTVSSHCADEAVAPRLGHVPNLRTALEEAIDRGCSGIISFGIAGGLAPDLAPGAWVVASGVVSARRRYATDADWARRRSSILHPLTYRGAIRMFSAFRIALCETRPFRLHWQYLPQPHG